MQADTAEVRISNADRAAADVEVAPLLVHAASSAPGLLAASSVRHLDYTQLRSLSMTKKDPVAGAVLQKCRLQGCRGRTRLFRDAVAMYEKVPTAAKTSPALALDFMNRYTVSHIRPVSQGGSMKSASNSVWEQRRANEARADSHMSFLQQQRAKVRTKLIENLRYAAIQGGKAAVDAGFKQGALVAAVSASVRQGSQYLRGQKDSSEATADFLEDVAAGSFVGTLATFGFFAAASANKQAPAVVRQLSKPAAAVFGVLVLVDAFHNAYRI